MSVSYYYSLADEMPPNFLMAENTDPLLDEAGNQITVEG